MIDLLRAEVPPLPPGLAFGPGDIRAASGPSPDELRPEDLPDCERLQHLGGAPIQQLSLAAAAYRESAAGRSFSSFPLLLSARLLWQSPFPPFDSCSFASLPAIGGTPEMGDHPRPRPSQPRALGLPCPTPSPSSFVPLPPSQAAPRRRQTRCAPCSTTSSSSCATVCAPYTAMRNWFSRTPSPTRRAPSGARPPSRLRPPRPSLLPGCARRHTPTSCAWPPPRTSTCCA